MNYISDLFNFTFSLAKSGYSKVLTCKMSSEQSRMDPWVDIVKPKVLLNTDDLPAEHREETVSVPIRRLSSSSPTLESIPEEDGEFEEIPHEPEHAPISAGDPVANVELTYGNSILHQIIWEEMDEEDDGSYYYEKDEYQLRAYPNGHPNDRAYTNFNSRLTKSEQEKLDNWLLSIYDATSEASLDMV